MTFDNDKLKTINDLYQQGLNDKSPKGSIDLPIYAIVEYLNSLDDCYTTSCCSGRLSIYTHKEFEINKGIHWLLVQHRICSFDEIRNALITSIQIYDNNDHDNNNNNNNNRMIYIKCEPLIIHLRCRNLQIAQTIHQIVMSCGYRESGRPACSSLHAAALNRAEP